MKKAATARFALLIAAIMLTTALPSCTGKKTSGKTASSSQASSSQAEASTVSTAPAGSSTIAIHITGPISSAGAGKTTSGVSDYTGNSVFSNRQKSKETKISINNPHIVAPTIPPKAPAASIIKKTEVEGVDGSFGDADLKETVKDLGGKTFILATCWPSEYQGGKGASTDAQRCADALKSIQKDYNCKIKLISYPGADKITSARSAGNVPANILDLLASGLHDDLLNGNGIDLRIVKSVGVETKPWNKALTLVSSYKRGVYGVGVRYDRLEQDILFFNKVLAGKYNLGDFYDMVNQGQWTDDRYLQVCQRFKKLSGGNTTVANAMYPQYFLNLVYTNWTSPFGITNKKYIFNGTDSTVLDILNFCQTCVKQGLFDTFVTHSDWKSDGTFAACDADYTHNLGIFNQGKELFFFGSNGDVVLPWVSQSAKNDYGLLPLPKGPSADDYSTVITNARFYSLFNGGPDVEDSGTLLVAIANRTNIKTADIIAHNSTLVRDKQSVTTLTQNYLHKQILNITLASAGKLPDIYNAAALKSAFLQEMTPKQAMDSIQLKAQTEINTNFGQ